MDKFKLGIYRNLVETAHINKRASVITKMYRDVYIAELGIINRYSLLSEIARLIEDFTITKGIPDYITAQLYAIRSNNG